MSLAERLEVKITSHSRAIDRLIYTQEFIGTQYGPKRLGKDTDTPEDTRRVVRRIRQKIQNETIPKTRTRLDYWSGIKQGLFDAEGAYEEAGKDYLDERIADADFEAAHKRVEDARAQVETVLTPPTLKRPTKPVTQVVIAQETGRAIERFRPLRLSRAFHDMAANITLKLMARESVALQVDRLQQGIDRVRSGQMILPPTGQFLRANDDGDKATLVELSEQSLRVLIGLRMVTDQGGFNQTGGLVSKLGADMNNLIAIAGDLQVAEAMKSLTPVEQLLFSLNLSVHMKEKLGNFDMEFCSPEDMAMYLRHSIFDRLVPNRRETIDLHPKDYYGEIKPLVSKRTFHTRDTRLPEDVLDILYVIADRDDVEPGFAQAVLECVLNPKIVGFTNSVSTEDKMGVVDFVFRSLIDILENEEMLEVGRNIFSTHNQTRRYARECSSRMGFEFGDRDYMPLEQLPDVRYDRRTINRNF